MADNRMDERRAMVDNQLIQRGITDSRIIAAFLQVPRHVFVPESRRHLAYCDGPLTIGEGQTISQPYVVALMMEALELEPDHRVLEIGTGSGYAAAVISRIVAKVYTIERLESLSRQAQKVIRELGYDNVELRIGDGTQGWEEESPFDAILVSAGAPQPPMSLLNQLKDGGTMVIPIGSRHYQDLIRIRRRPDGSTVSENLGAVRFVPLIGTEGWEVT